MCYRTMHTEWLSPKCVHSEVVSQARRDAFCRQKAGGAFRYAHSCTTHACNTTIHASSNPTTIRALEIGGTLKTVISIVVFG